MSTPAWKKAARREQHKQEKLVKQRKKLFATNNKKKEFKEYVPESTFRRSTPNYPSLSEKGAVLGHDTGKQQPKQYSGDYVIGIAAMHKSNLVPVGREDSPESYATMRRN